MTKDDPWIVCPVCEGEGKTVNPNIDCNGLTREDFDEDPDFREDYMSGVYDITCAACHGNRVVKQARIRELEQNAEDRRLAARENGDYEAYCGASDWRFG
jgi:hypothetical protein